MLVRDIVVSVDRRRRANATSRRVWRAAPAVAGVVLVVAIVARVCTLTPVLPLAAFVLGAAALAAASLIGRRRRDVSDAEAAAIDGDASLGGELRSAHWFAAQPARDAWEAFHLDQAAERAAAVRWDALYPPVDVRRASALSAALVVAAVAVTFSVPARRAAVLTTSARNAAAGSGPTLIALPEDLRKRLEELLSKIERGGVTADEARAQVAELKDLMSKVDPSLEASLADLAKRAAEGVVADRSRQGDETRALADRTEQAAQTAEGLPQDVRFSLENLAAKLANQSPQQADAKSGEKSGAQNAEQQQGSAGGSSVSEAMKGGLMIRESAADPGGEMTMAGAGAASGDSRPGAGGNRGSGGPGQLLDIEKALRKETVEANTDTAGANVIAEVRRKTEQGQAKVAFTHAAAPSAFAPSHATPPPPIPEDRRALLLSYFIRRQ